MGRQGRFKSPVAEVWIRTTTILCVTMDPRSSRSKRTQVVNRRGHYETSPHLVLILWCCIVLVRILVGYQPYSGQDNYHGRRVGAYGGDFEAQRHWMEVTWSLPIAEWYRHDLEYWGLDYPPLSAYQSWLCGALSHILVGPETVALHTSRFGALEGHVAHRAFMRASVLVLDILCYGSAVYYISIMVFQQKEKRKSSFVAVVSGVTAMLQPALILIDHGHFQYNTVALGLALWSFTMASGGSSDVNENNNNQRFTFLRSIRPDLVACVLFVCALSFKQMTLYYAPAIFAFLLGKCCSGGGAPEKDHLFWKVFGLRFVSYGLTVIITLVVVWWPFLTRWETVEQNDMQEEDDTINGRRWLLWQVLHRIFPVHRGLFEDKVANIWFVLSLGPMRVTNRIPPNLHPVAALVLTLFMAMPACLRLFQLGRQHHHVPRHDQLSVLLLGTACTALSFFLGAFHVHEKSILLALAPASLVLQPDLFRDWFALVATWSLWPLLILDRLQVAYVCTIILYVCARRILTLLLVEEEEPQEEDKAKRVVRWIQMLLIFGSGLIMIGLHVLEFVVTPPSHLPHLFAVLWSISGCGFYVVAWITMVWQLYYAHDWKPIGSLSPHDKQTKLD